jgi:hypothetical protein
MTKPIDESNLTPLQRAFLDGFKKGWNLACDHLGDRIEQADAAKARYDAIEKALSATRDPGDQRQ